MILKNHYLLNDLVHELDETRKTTMAVVSMCDMDAEYVRIPEKAIIQGNIAPLDDTISYSEAAMVEPLSCVYNGQELLGNLYIFCHGRIQHDLHQYCCGL